MNKDSAWTAVAAAEWWIIDLDGVVWLSGTAIGDVGTAVETLRQQDRRLLFVTNNSAPTTAVLLQRLADVGIKATPEDLVTSAEAAASLLTAGERVNVLAEDGVAEALSARGVVMVEEPPYDAAVVGWTHHFDFDSVSRAADAARSSGRLIGTNEDPTPPTPTGLTAGSGAILAAVATASGVAPTVAGKPHDATVELIEARTGHGSRSVSMVLVGDQPGTDGKLAERLSVPFVLVDSGVTSPDTAVDHVPVCLRVPTFVALVAGLPSGDDGR